MKTSVLLNIALGGLCLYLLSVQFVAWKHADQLVLHLQQQHADARMQQQPRSLGITEYTNLQKRVALLESKLDTYLAFGSDPFLSSKAHVKCNTSSYLQEYCKKKKPLYCELGMKVCMDKFPPPQKQQDDKKKCIIYDMGIREEPDFGAILAQDPFNCQVYAFDPSPITQRWFKSDNPEAAALRSNPNYKLFHYGAGGADEKITLREYNWDQITIYHYPESVLDPTNCTDDGHCRYKRFPVQAQHRLPVRSVESLMKEFDHDHIDILKLDIEGSEYQVLESLIQSGACRRINQIVLEWHHYDIDLRYGASSIPMLNVLVRLLQEQCGLSQFHVYTPGGWPSNEKIYGEMQIILRYNLASFMRVS
jgi:FkbM family methyltransferase